VFFLFKNGIKASLLLFVLLFQLFSSIKVEAQTIPSINPILGYSYNLKGSIEIENQYFLYGFQRNMETNETDALLIAYDWKTNTVLMNYVYDIGYDETFVYAGIFSDGSFGVIARNMKMDPVYHYLRFESMEVLKFDLDGFYLGKVRFSTDFYFYGNLDYCFYFYDDLNHVYAVNELLETEQMTSRNFISQGTFQMQMQGKVYINQQLMDSIDITEPGFYDIELMDQSFYYLMHLELRPLIEGIADGDFREEPITINTHGECYLNGNPYLIGSEITRPGNYQLDIYGALNYHEQIHFTLLPTMEGVSDGDVTKNAIRITSNATSMTLNGEAYQSEMITFPGIYELITFGESFYSDTITFTILPSVTGVGNEMNYEEAIHIKVNGTAFLNGERMSSDTDIIESGSYQIVTMLNDLVVEELYFTVTIPSPIEEYEETIVANDDVVKVFLGVLILIGLFLMIKKK